MAKVIPSDFNWKEYYPYQTINPEANPEKEIKRTSPNIDYAGEGLITIFSIPVYFKDVFTGIWSVDVPLKTIHDIYKLNYYTR